MRDPVMDQAPGTALGHNASFNQEVQVIHDLVFVLVVGQSLFGPRVDARLHGHTSLSLLLDLIICPSEFYVFYVLFRDLGSDAAIRDPQNVVVLRVEGRPSFDRAAVLQVYDRVSVFGGDVGKPAAVGADGRKEEGVGLVPAGRASTFFH